MRAQKLIMAAALAAGLCAGQARGATIQSAGTGGYWTNPASWNPAQVPGINDEAIITNGCTVTMNDMVTRSVSNLTIQAGGVLTHTANSGSELYKVILNIVSNLTIESGGAIDVTSKGYSAGNGPGKTVGTACGSYGGIGGYYDGPGTTYGSIVAPTNCGSGGYGPGGGAIILTVGGETTLNGSLVARNYVTASGDPLNYSGSGGTVYLTTATLTGSGTIDAGAGGGNNSGGGGRIAVILTNATDFAGVRMKAYSAVNGAAGTIYTQTKDQQAGKGTLRVDGGNVVPAALCSTLQNGKAASSNEFAEIILTNAAKYGLDGNDTLIITNTSVRGGSANRREGFYLLGGTLTVPAAFAWSNYYIWIGHTGTVFAPAPLTVGTNATLRIDVPWTMSSPALESGGYLTFNAPIVLNGSLTMPTGCVLDHTANYDTEAYKVSLTINGALDVQASAQVTADGRGYAGGYGPGKGTGGGAGGGYGGVGGYWSGGPTPGLTYGSITAPTNCGSGGTERAGGGAVILRVKGETTLNGTLAARCSSAIGYRGSGGSVFLTTATLTGSGTIDAGGAGDGNYACGGGGRISVVLTNGNTFESVKMRTYTISTGAEQGSPGTIYKQTVDQGPGKGTLVVDANGIMPGAVSSTLIWGNVTDTTVGTVIVTNSARFAVSNQTLTVQGDWVNKATFIAMTNSTVNFAGATVSTIYTNNTFFNLTCTNAGKVLSFEAGRTNTVNGLLKLGASQSGQTVTLQSTTNGSWSYLTLVPGGTQQIARVNVKDNNGGGGQTLLAGGGSANGGNNINWQFPPSGTMFVVK